jgi:short-subunit dehydrogenase
MCPMSSSGNTPSDPSAARYPQPEPELDRATPRFLAQRQPQFLSRRTKNAKGVLIGGAAFAGAAALGAAALAAAAASAAWKLRTRRLDGKIVLITGSSRGLGLALAEEFGRRGARIVLTARGTDELDRARALLLQRHVVAGPDQLLVLPADLRDPDDALRLVQRVTNTWGQIDILVNNAGVITVGPVENQSLKDFRDVMDANFFTGLHCTLAVLPQMLSRRDGSIVNIASIGGKVAVPHLLPYTASKFAAVGFSQGLHAELRHKGVHVLTVCPGLMRTGSHVNAAFSGNAEKEYRWFSLGATTPGVSSSAAGAARKIVRAVIARATEIAITPQAILMSRLAQVSPEITGLAMSTVNRFLPDPSDQQSGPVAGKHVRGLEPIPARSIGWSAARRYNEVDGVSVKP